MLVLTRDRDQRIFIGEGADQVVITVIEIRHGNKVRLGIEAPKHIPVHREEIYNEIHHIVSPFDPIRKSNP